MKNTPPPVAIDDWIEDKKWPFIISMDDSNSSNRTLDSAGSLSDDGRLYKREWVWDGCKWTPFNPNDFGVDLEQGGMLEKMLRKGPDPSLLDGNDPRTDPFTSPVAWRNLQTNKCG